jgi:hypothetical protein
LHPGYSHDFAMMLARSACREELAPQEWQELVDFDKASKKQVNRMVQRANEGLV